MKTDKDRVKAMDKKKAEAKRWHVRVKMNTVPWQTSLIEEEEKNGQAGNLKVGFPAEQQVKKTT